MDFLGKGESSVRSEPAGLPAGLLCCVFPVPRWGAPGEVRVDGTSTPPPVLQGWGLQLLTFTGNPL